MLPLRRRRALEVVAAGGLAALAGCAGGPPDCEPRVGFRLDPVTDADVADVADRPPERLHPLARDLVRSAGASGTATYHSAPDRPDSAEPFPISRPGDPAHRYVRLDGSHHRIVVDPVAEGTTTEYSLVRRVTGDVGVDARPGDTVDVEDLPSHDRRSVHHLLGNRALEQDDIELESVWSLGYLRADHVESSLLVPRPAHDHLSYRDWFLAVERVGTERDTRVTYDVSLEHVADSEDGLAAEVKRTDGVDLDAADLPAEQRRVLDEAADGRRWICLDGQPRISEGSSGEDGGEDDVEWVDRDPAEEGDLIAPESVGSLVETIGDARYARYGGQWYAVSVPRWYRFLADD